MTRLLNLLRRRIIRPAARRLVPVTFVEALPEWARALYVYALLGLPPVAGGAPDDDDDGGGGGDDDGDSDDDDGDGDDDDSGDDSGDDDDDGDDEDRISRSDFEQVQRELADERKRRKRLERDQRRAKRERQSATGEHEQRAREEKERADKLERGAKLTALKSAVVAKATSLGFRNPSLIVNMVNLSVDDVVELDEDTGEADVDGREIERKLEALKKSDPYLVKERARQRDLDRDDDRERGSRRRSRDRDDDRDGDDDVKPGAGRLRRAFEKADAIGAGDRS